MLTCKFVPKAYWPCCKECNGRIWKFHRKPEGEGRLETQSFTCSRCDYVTVLVVDVLPGMLLTHFQRDAEAFGLLAAPAGEYPRETARVT